MLRNKPIVISIILTVFVIVLFLKLISLHNDNHSKKNEIKRLSRNCERVEKELLKRLQENKRIDLLRYKEQVLNKKYPMFSRIIDIVYKKSQEYDFDPMLILGIIETESDFKPDALSSKGAYGLMQVNYSAWKNELEIIPNRLFEIEYNIEIGLKILKESSLDYHPGTR